MARSKPVTDDRVWGEIERAAAISGGTAPHGAGDIATQIQRLITTGDLPEGARLPSERDLAGIFATSRPTVSQAIRILVVRGLIESRRGSGAYVTSLPEAELATTVGLMLDLNQESVLHLSELRLQLETTGIQWAVERATAEQVEAGKAALEQMRSSMGYAAPWMSSDTHFHSTLVRASHNPYLASMFESVHGTLIQYEYQTMDRQRRGPRVARQEGGGRRCSRYTSPSLRRFAFGTPTSDGRPCCATTMQWRSEVIARHLRQRR